LALQSAMLVEKKYIKVIHCTHFMKRGLLHDRGL
jgi:hypothetical protein